MTPGMHAASKLPIKLNDLRCIFLSVVFMLIARDDHQRALLHVEIEVAAAIAELPRKLVYDVYTTHLRFSRNVLSTKMRISFLSNISLCIILFQFE